MNKVRYYYSFDELLTEESITNWTKFRSFINDNAEFYNSAEPMLGQFEAVYRLIVNQHLNDYVYYVDYWPAEINDPNFTEDPDFTEFARQFYAVYLQSYDRYKIILDYYTAQKANLLNKIENEIETKFNDTPQNGGNFNNDDHLSTITTQTNSIEVQPLINRLNDIDKYYKDTIADWAAEFNGLFIQNGPNDYE